jgi:hypothetical protein
MLHGWQIIALTRLRDRYAVSSCAAFKTRLLTTLAAELQSFGEPARIRTAADKYVRGDLADSAMVKIAWGRSRRPRVSPRSESIRRAS